MTVTRNPAASGLRFDIELSSDLTAWGSGSPSITILENTANRLKARANQPATTAIRQHLRLRVSVP